MTAISTDAPIKNAVVRRIRSSAELKAALKGGVHQRLAPRRQRYPFLVYNRVSGVATDDWGGPDGPRRTWHVLMDVSIFALNPVEAEILDSLVDGLLGGRTADLELQAYLDGLTVTLCRRTASMPTGPDRDNEGRRIAQVGGTYEIEAYQSLPS